MQTHRRRRALLESLEYRRLLSFGLTSTTASYNVDTGAGVTFSVLRGGTLTSTVHLGDLTSFKLNGTEFAAPFASPGPQRYSHFESGLSSTAVVTATVDPSGNWIKIAADDTTATAGAGGTGVIQYYLAKKNDPVIYMAVYAPEMKVSSTRFITYLDWSKFPNHPDESDTSAIHGTGQSTIESGDVFQDPVDGHSHSKYYAENRLLGHVYHGATGPNAGAFMFIGNRESGSGGPFWKDIDFQSTGAAVELYNMPYSDHSQTEAFRPGLHGPYALVLTSGGAPAVTPNYSFMEGAGITGLVPAAARGTLSGNASGVPAGHVPTVALSNSAAQYWATPDASGNYTIANVKPGTYTQTLYRDELAVGTIPVTILAGKTTRQNITDTYFVPAPADTVFRIGKWDGTPLGFLNADKISDMHPSDPRMSPWATTSAGSTNFTVGTDADSAWPMAEWKQQNAAAPYTDTSNRITFNLTADQIKAMTFRIGLTRAGTGGRPIISVNGGNYSAAPAASTQPNTRGVTLGSWRGNNWTYTYNVSAASLHVGSNTIDIGVASGSSSGSAWLGPWYIYDALELVTAASLTNQPKLTSISVAPASPNVLQGSQQTLTATARDQFGNVMPANLVWTALQGSVDGTGFYTASSTSGSDTVTATSGAIKGTTTVNVLAPLKIDGASFLYESSQVLAFTFNRNVDPAGLDGALEILNLTTLRKPAAHLIMSDQTGQFSFDGILEDGNYRATLRSVSVADLYGFHMSADFSFDFFVFAGDANRDRQVDSADLEILSTNWQGTSKTFSQGDFNYDGQVDLLDLNILTSKWQQSLPEMPIAIKPPRRTPVRVASSVLV